MDMQKTGDQSHVSDCSDAMFTFVSKEGVNSYPTSVVLLNRFFFSPDEFEWVKNSGISIQLPTFKPGDDIHWYKLSDLYTNLKNSVISGSVFKDIPLFKPIKFTVSEKSTKAYKTKTRYYIYDSDKKQMYWSNTFDKDKFIHYSLASTPIIDPIDMLSVDDIDYLLCKNSIWRFKPDDTCSKVYDENNTTYNAFDAGCDRIVVASNDGAKIFTDTGEQLILNDTVKYKTTTVSVSNSDDSSDNESSSDSSGEESSTTSVTVSNGIPSSNKCTFVWIDGGKMYVGDITTSCNLPVIGPYDHTPTDEQLKDQTVNPGKEVSEGTNKHFDGINGINTPKGWEYGTDIFGEVSNVVGVYNGRNLTYISNNDKITVFLNDDTTKKLTEFTSGNNIGGSPVFIEIKDGDIWILVNGEWKRTYNPSDPEIPFTFILFNFVFERDSDKDSIDCRVANVTVDEFLSLSFSKSVYDKYFTTAMTGPTTFMVSYSKGSKTAFNVFGNDIRKAKAEEMKKCCNAFDVGEDN